MKSEDKNMEEFSEDRKFNSPDNMISCIYGPPEMLNEFQDNGVSSDDGSMEKRAGANACTPYNLKEFKG